MIQIIGTSHIAKESVDRVKATLEFWKPDIVAVELDRGRLEGLMSKEKTKITFRSARQVGFKGAAFAMIASWATKKLGKVVGMEPGEEMLTAVQLAKQQNLKVALIDQNISITLRRFSKTLTWKERWNFVADIFSSIFFRKREMARLGVEDMDLTKVPSNELIEKLVERMKDRYPNVYNVLVEERNQVMARNLRMIQAEHPDAKILAVVGAGHEKGMRKLLSEPKMNITVNAAE
jgi:pheromone shutdown-related protein TraB